MFNFCPVAPERVTVERDALAKSVELVRALPCTRISCKNATQHGRVLCERCTALDALTRLEVRPV